MIRRLAARLRPRTFRARLALTIAAALLVAVLLIQGGLGLIVERRVQQEVEVTLAEQADAAASAVARDPRNATARAREAARFLPDVRMVVRVDDEAVFWNTPVEQLEAQASATRGPIEVTLQREDSASALDTPLLFLLVAVGVLGTGALVWFASGTLARRLGRAVDELTATAEQVAEGDVAARAPQRDDELGRLAVAFNRMTARLEAADARQRAFLADAAHELRTPVTAIEGFAGALTDGTADDPAAREEAAESIRDEAARLRDLVRDLQELTWLDLEPPVAREPTDLAEVAGEVAAAFRVRAEEEGVELAVDDDGPAQAETDPAHVHTIVSNLVENALNATGAGGTLRLTANGAAWGARLRVTDTGVGIAAEHLPYVFERLYRAQPGRDRERGGSGLGLPIVRRLATLLGGRVSIDSELGTGTGITVWIPGAPPAARTAPRGAAEEARA